MWLNVARWGPRKHSDGQPRPVLALCWLSANTTATAVQPWTHRSSNTCASLRAAIRRGEKERGRWAICDVAGQPLRGAHGKDAPVRVVGHGQRPRLERRGFLQ